MAGAGHSRLIFALDVPSLEQAEPWVARLAPHVDYFKVGLELFSSAGPEAVRMVTRHGQAGVFLDLKLHDIPTTVGRAARVVCGLGVRMLTVHAQGGRAMLEAAAREAGPDLCLLAVTRLTSQAAAVEEVVELARLAQLAGCGGVVCAGSEAASVRKAVGTDFRIVCPGVRAPGSDRGDQVRAVTPFEAIHAGADYIVVGRPIRDAADPVQAARAISAEVARALAS
jgi:orotidine-5'-phosphate decarboxylase